ncbi:hypothetical protein ElyMa_003419200 [Elysia marginata]|uniref:Uncharacterized protein n=1 Tax=Elysia marginata TaxID=1093978 RepID=A0AAV4JQB6_9GAST|nr:hypothetical protein ElyMa_003419200 [Elysia marginata]
MSNVLESIVLCFSRSVSSGLVFGCANRRSLEVLGIDGVIGDTKVVMEAAAAAVAAHGRERFITNLPRILHPTQRSAFINGDASDRIKRRSLHVVPPAQS